MDEQRTSVTQAAGGTNASAEAKQNVYTDVYRLLIVGMIVSTILFLVGLILALVHTRYFPLSVDWVRQQ